MAILAIVLTFLTSTTVAYQVHKKTLINSTLETNYAYVQKLTSTTDTYLREILNTLEVNAEVVLTLLDDPSSQTQINAVAERIRLETNTFDSVAIASPEGTILGASSPSLELVGEKLTSIGAMQAIKEKREIVSHPYVGIEGEPIIFISVPLFEGDEYKGFLGGAIYLDKPNILEKLLGNHYYENGSYVYVVDYAGKLIYHQEKERLKEDVSSNLAVQKVIKGESDFTQLVNTKGIPMLAGYAYVPIAEWGIVVQRQLDISVAPAKKWCWRWQ